MHKTTDAPQLNKALIIDPDESQSRGTSLALDDLFQEIRHVSSPQEAVTLLTRESFDIVITEIRFPTMDGLKLLDALRKASPQTPIIVWSAHYDKVLEEARERFHIDGFLEKPVRLESLREHILSIIHRHQSS